jgi:beta-glucosidase
MVMQFTRREVGAMAGAAAIGPSAVAITAARAQDPSPDERARDIEQRMTDDERFSLISSLMVVVYGGGREERVPADVPQIAGYVPGIPRLGIPAQKLTDGPLGITNPGGGRPGDTATALPAGLALGSTFDPGLARESGAILGREARARGFNVVLGGGINLARDPRNGRNFEYISEDPWLSAVMSAESVIGTQAQGVIAMVKHLSLNVNEINKFWLDAVIDPEAHRESDLLAFQIAIERAQPGSLMGAYNKLNGEYCCGNSILLNDIVKGAFGFRGYVMSDWKAVYGWNFALDGLDQHSGAQLDAKEWFNQPLRAALSEGKFPRERLSDMVRRILRSIYAVGIDQWGPAPAVDMARHNASALEVARQGIVLLKNDGALPLAPDKQRIAVIGGQAHLGVLAGGGSSQTTPPGGYAAIVPLGGEGPMSSVRRQVYLPSSPLDELQNLLPGATITYDPGAMPAEAAALARRSDVAIVFVTKFESEGYDSADLSLPFGQDALVEAVASVNPNTLVVLETGNGVDMPWRGKVKAIVAAWYPGQAGGQAIAEILAGKVNPSGRLPVTFVASLGDTPRPELPGFGTPLGTPTTIRYDEGAEVGYRWLARTGAKPLYPFGHGLSYTSFAYRDLEAGGGETVTAAFTVENTGAREGADVPQLYLTDAAGDKRMRLLAFERVPLKPGELKRVTMTADPRLLARFDGTAGRWRITEGIYRIALGASAEDLELRAEVPLAGRLFGT